MLQFRLHERSSAGKWNGYGERENERQKTKVGINVFPGKWQNIQPNSFRIFYF